MQTRNSSWLRKEFSENLKFRWNCPRIRQDHVTQSVAKFISCQFFSSYDLLRWHLRHAAHGCCISDFSLGAGGGRFHSTWMCTGSWEHQSTPQGAGGHHLPPAQRESCSLAPSLSRTTVVRQPLCSEELSNFTRLQIKHHARQGGKHSIAQTDRLSFPAGHSSKSRSSTQPGKLLLSILASQNNQAARHHYVLHLIGTSLQGQPHIQANPD